MEASEERLGPRFRVARHEPGAEGGRLHWDLFIEAGEVLWTWRIEVEPVGAGPWPVERIKDHRRIYLSFEGEIEGGRGHVSTFDGGAVLARATGAGLELVLEGARLRGRFRLAPMNNSGVLARLEDELLPLRTTASGE